MGRRSSGWSGSAACTSSIRTAEHAGFDREGLLRSYMEISGQRRDLLLYAAVR